MQVQTMEDDKVGLLLFHADNIDGVIELDNSKPSLVSKTFCIEGQTACSWLGTAGRMHSYAVGIVCLLMLHMLCMCVYSLEYVEDTSRLPM